MVITVIATLFISKQWPVLHSHFTDTQRGRYFYAIPGSALFHDILSTHHVESSLACGRLCLINDMCVSFNFGTVPSIEKKFVCMLSSAALNEFPLDLQKQSEFDYFEYVVSKHLLTETIYITFLSMFK